MGLDFYIVTIYTEAMNLTKVAVVYSKLAEDNGKQCYYVREYDTEAQTKEKDNRFAYGDFWTLDEVLGSLAKTFPNQEFIIKLVDFDQK